MRRTAHVIAVPIPVIDVTRLESQSAGEEQPQVGSQGA